MTEREKVIHKLERCLTERQRPSMQDLHDALALLQSQEPKLVHVTADINRRKVGECPNCGKMINSGDYPNYCGRCGQAVKWE